MYLPPEINKARVLILVKTYPLPNSNYGETVCTAGLLSGEKWFAYTQYHGKFLRMNRNTPNIVGSNWIWSGIQVIFGKKVTNLEWDLMKISK